MKWTVQKRNRNLYGVGLVFLGALVFGGCTKPMNVIEGTTIPATEPNVAIVQRVEAYRDAFRNRDAAKILSMVSDSYHGHRGTASPEDDYNKVGFAKKLQHRLPLMKDTFVGIHYESVEIDKTGVYATVKLRYKLHAQMALGSGEFRWIDKEQSQQMTLAKENSQWQFTSGL